MEKIRVVVTGTGVLSPVGNSTESAWNAVVTGRSGVAPITLFDASEFETQIAAEVKNFSAEKILGGKVARRMDKFSQFGCAAALEAVENAELDMARENPDRVAVIIGSGVGGIQTITEAQMVLKLDGPTRVSPFVVPKMLNDMASGQVSIMLGAKGPNYSIVSACATGTDSIGEAAEMIRRGRVDAAIAGGAEAAVCEISVASFNACMALSKRNDDPEKASRPFDAGRDGFVLGEGAGILVIESLEHAEKRGAKPIAEIVGYGASSDATHITQPDPQGDGACRAMEHALAQANMKPSDISYINAHGTSTQLNDKVETMAVKKVFGNLAYKVKVSSTKSMTGHMLGAAGSVEAIFSIRAITESVIPPTINLEEPDPNCDLDYVPHLPVRGRVVTAMSNSLGFGGHNATLIFSEFRP